jgi:hypothetical protein
MYCPQCGRAATGPVGTAPAENHCAHCDAALPLRVAGPGLPGWAVTLTRPRYFGSLLGLLLLLVAGLVFSAWWRTRLPAPGRTVDAFYTAVAARDKDAIRELVVPDERDLGLGFCLNLLTQPTVSTQFEDITTRVVSRDGGEAQVRSTGQVRRELDGRTFEIGFNDLFELVAVDRAWRIRQRSLSTLSLCGDL